MIAIGVTIRNSMRSYNNKQCNVYKTTIKPRLENKVAKQGGDITFVLSKNPYSHRGATRQSTTTSPT